MKKENQNILTPLVSLDTPGKATVEVVILADPVSLSREAKSVRFNWDGGEKTEKKSPLLCKTG